MKLIFTFILLIFLTNCSLNKDSKYWTENEVIKKEDEKELSILIENSLDITKMTIKEYENYIDDYSKKSKYPDISK